MSFKLAEKPVLIEGVTFVLREFTLGEEWDCIDKASHFEGPLKQRVMNNTTFGRLILEVALVKVIGEDGKDIEIPDKAKFVHNLPARIGNTLALEVVKMANAEALANFR